jgi:NAD(P)-dependent dehydrogenase (short-subunit alcohol dehydrogenase family)
MSESEGGLAGQVALVTGAAKGLGKAIALELADRGAAVALCDRDVTSAGEVADEVAALGGEATVVACDLRDEEQVRTMVAQAASAYSRLDILVNNAGIGTVAPLWETPTAVWDDIMAVNLRGTFLCTKHVVPHMLERRSGRIINMASAVGRQAQPLIAAYGISKAGMISMTVALAKELAEHGITVNAVCPGPVATPWWDEPRKALAGVLGVAELDVVSWFTQNKQAIKQAIVPGDVAKIVAWLTTPDTRLVTGQVIPIDGGHEFPTY